MAFNPLTVDWWISGSDADVHFVEQRLWQFVSRAKINGFGDVQFNAALRPQRPYRLLGTGSPGRPPRLSHSS